MQNLKHESNFSKVFISDSLMEIYWKSQTDDMTDEDFKTETSIFAEISENYHPEKLYANTSDFKFIINASLQEWHDKNIITRYAKAGLKKLAMLTSKDYIPQISIELLFDEEIALKELQVKYFIKQLNALEWLNN